MGNDETTRIDHKPEWDALLKKSSDKVHFILMGGGFVAMIVIVLIGILLSSIFGVSVKPYAIGALIGWLVTLICYFFSDRS